MDGDADARSGPGWLAVGVIGAVEFVLAADGLIIAVAPPAIDAELGFGTSQLPWVVSAFVLAYGGLLLSAGRAADLFGRRRVVVIGLACVAIGSAGAALLLRPACSSQRAPSRVSGRPSSSLPASPFPDW